MISIDFEWPNRHRFEGYFKDHGTYTLQANEQMIACPICDSKNVKRIYSGCSIHARQRKQQPVDQVSTTLFQLMKAVKHFVKNNYEYVGNNFAATARAIHYGQEMERGIYGESTGAEIEELHEEGIDFFPIINVDKMDNEMLFTIDGQDSLYKK